MIALSISTQARCELRDITAEIRSLVARWADERQRRDGALLLFSPHTTCGLTINEGADPDVRRDWSVFSAGWFLSSPNDSARPLLRMRKKTATPI